MNDTVSRIEAMLTEHFNFTEMEWHDLPADEFDEAFGDDEPQARYGWTLPEVGFFCLERLSAQTAHLEEFHVDCYIEAILWMCDRHVILAHEMPDLGALERHDMIESELYDVAPGSMTLMSEIEMKALDR